MEFLGISIWELLLILVVVLIVLGPNRLPGIARSLGKAIRTIKQASSSFTTAITREMDSPEDTKSSANTNATPKAEKPKASPGTISTTKEKSQPEKPEGQPPQNEQ